MEQGLKDLKAALSVMDISQEKQDTILKESEVFFEFQAFLMKKHDITKEAAEKMGTIYTQSKLSKLLETDEEAMDKIAEGDMSLMYDLIGQFAEEQGFDKPIANSMKVVTETMMEIYKSRTGEE